MKKVIFRVVAALMLFAAVVIGIIFFQTKNMGTSVGYDELAAPTLPTVSFSFGGYDANVRFGYRSEEAAAKEYLPLLPLDETRSVQMKVTPYDSRIKEVVTQLRSIDRERLIEEKEWNDFSQSEEPIFISYEASALIEEGIEYFLSIRIVLEDGSESWHAVRIEQLPLENRDMLLGFARQFSEATVSKQEEFIRPYLTQDTDRAGRDLSYVNLNNSFNLISWAGLQPVVGERRLAIYEWEKNQITVNFLYDCSTEYEGENSDYEVEETYCVRLRDDKLYLLNYERYVEEIFAGNADSVGNTSILLGITQPEKLDMLYTNYGISVTFCVNGGVWNYDYNSNTLTKIFSFRDGSKDIRRNNGAHDIKLVGVDEEGNIYFSVLGYMNSGAHEGCMGLSLYCYEKDTQELSECFFAESKEPYPLLSEQAAHMSYLNEQKLYYVDFEGCVYSIDLVSKECLTLAEGTDESRILVSDSGSLAVWQNREDASQIFMLNMKNGQLQTVEEDGKELFPCGFLEEDFIYAICANEKWEKEGFLYRDLYEELVIVDGNMEEQQRYRKDNLFLTDIQVEAYSVLIGRVEKDGNSYRKIAGDVLALAEHPTNTAVVEIKVATSEIKRNYYYINLGRVIANLSRLSTDQARLVAEETHSFSLGQEMPGELLYTAYSGGHIQKLTEDPEKAVEAVFDTMGSVYRGGALVWNRGMRDLYLTVKLPVMSWTLEGHEEEMAAMDSLERGVDILIYAGVDAGAVTEETAGSEERKKCRTVREELEIAFGEQMLAFRDCQITHLLYYLNLRHPVLAITGENTALILVGYTSGEVQIYDPATREITTYAQSEAQEYFEKQNAVFVTF